MWQNQKQEQNIDSITAKTELSIEIAKIALRCPGCRNAVKELIQKSGHNIVSHLGGGHSSLAATNENGETIVHTIHEYK